MRFVLQVCDAVVWYRQKTNIFGLTFFLAPDTKFNELFLEIKQADDIFSSVCFYFMYTKF